MMNVSGNDNNIDKEKFDIYPYDKIKERKCCPDCVIL